ncbi:unnamed protein product [Paramecium octaurelia]|uniref:Uncharacterized protein n=1 Tax=Paramecium octaurelia TaxID=43137 RepID=A0A8S1XDX2_PAROT|nr:unnamed protein product [Paramecium octaurelia]CAD8199148.1 unnamed protein product [Paramecium octaurelia]
MNHIIQQPKTTQKQKKPSNVVSKHPEIQSNKTLDDLRNKEWSVAIQKEIDQFEQTIHEVEALFKEASTSQHLVSLGTFKLVQDEYEFAAQKLQHLREMLAQYSDDRSKYHQNKQKLKALTNKQEKSAEDNEAISKITKDQQNFKYTIMNQRDRIQFQLGVAQRVLTLIQAYIKLKDQYQNQQELQRHRDYILSKIDKIKKTEEKHTKKIERHYNRIQVEDPDAPEEIEVEDEQSEEEQAGEETNTAREDLLKLCDSVISYLQKFEKKEGDQFIQHDLTTFQYFDQIKVAAPFYLNQIDVAIDLIKSKRAFYENAPETEFTKKEAKQVVQQQEQKVDVTNEQEFPKLS